MTGYEIAYLAMAIAGLGAFAIVVGWATHLTNPKQRGDMAFK